MHRAIHSAAAPLAVALLLSATAARAEAPGLWGIYQDVFKDAKYIDLTHAFEPVQSVWPGFRQRQVQAGRGWPRH